MRRMSATNKSAVPKPPISKSFWSKLGATPLAKEKKIPDSTKSTSIPVPMGGAEAIFSATKAAISSSERFSLSATPPDASIATCCAIALSQASCP